MSWTPPEVEMLRKLWIEGQSASHIAPVLNAAFRTSYSRNAVIGKIHRMKLADVRQKPAKPAPKPKLSGAQRRKAAWSNNTVSPYLSRRSEPRAQAKAFGETRVPPVYIIAGSGAVIEKPPGKSPRRVAREAAFLPLLGSVPMPWLERAFGQCAWPVGGEGMDTLSCGLPCGAGAYCGSHLELRKGHGTPSERRASKTLKRAAA